VFYFDTSFVAPLLLHEDTSDSIERFVRGLVDEALVLSHWTCLEFNSVVARRVRMKLLDADLAGEVLKRFDALVEQSFDLLVPAAADFRLARQYVADFRTGLRGGDALHLAIAANAGVQRLLTLDTGLLRAAKLLKLPATSGPRAR
jgi:uncharacterized protein